jgi:hypothetical protein
MAKRPSSPRDADRRRRVARRMRIEERARKARVSRKANREVARRAASKKENKIEIRKRDGTLWLRIRLDKNSAKRYQKLAASKMAGHDIKDFDTWLRFLNIADQIGDPRANQFRKRNKPSPKDNDRENEDIEDEDEAA